MDKFSFCIVNEDRVYNLFANLLLKSHNITNEVNQFKDAHEAISWLLTIDAIEDFPTVILVDLQMSKLTGWDFVSILNHLSPAFREKLNVFFVDVYPSQEQKIKALQTPFVKGILSKPFQDSHLHIIAKHVRSTSVEL